MSRLGLIIATISGLLACTVGGGDARAAADHKGIAAQIDAGIGFGDVGLTFTLDAGFLMTRRDRPALGPALRYARSDNAELALNQVALTWAVTMDQDRGLLLGARTGWVFTWGERATPSSEPTAAGGYGLTAELRVGYKHDAVLVGVAAAGDLLVVSNIGPFHGNLRVFVAARF